MSRSTKPGDQYFYEYSSTTRDRPLHDYDTFVQPAHTVDSFNPSLRSPALLTSTPIYEYRPAAPTIVATTAYPSHSLALTGPSLRLLPEVTSYTPRASPTNKVFVHIRSNQDLNTLPPLHFGIQFYEKESVANMTNMAPIGIYFQYALDAEVPSFDTPLRSSTIPLQLKMRDEDGRLLSSVPLGDLIYSNSPEWQPYNAPSSQSHKRRRSPESEEFVLTQAKRPSHQYRTDVTWDPFQWTQSSDYVPQMVTGAYELARVPSPSYLPYSHMAGPSSHFNTQYNTPAYHSASVDLAVPQIQIQFNPSKTMNQHRRNFPAMPTPASSNLRSRRAPNTTPTPSLIRTSALQTSSNASQNLPPPFNPYTMYPNKATLELQGDLNDVAKNWNAVEREVKRRLIEFNRTQADSVITASFKVVSLVERTSKSICVSCIWWEEKQECFITSVDVIHLLESLVGVRFTVEEKNRVRRNLEGFKPLTVSKGKADSDDFFKVIMAFPSPKPRNIEKDVKVFPWKSLTHALKKIISKYSASYSSTAAALNQSSTTGGPSVVWQTSAQRATRSPQSVVTLSPSPSLERRSKPVTTSELGGAMSAILPNAHVAVQPSTLRSPDDQYPASIRYRQTSTPRQHYRAPSSWEFGNFIETNPTTTPGLIATPSLAYPYILSPPQAGGQRMTIQGYQDTSQQSLQDP